MIFVGVDSAECVFTFVCATLVLFLVSVFVFCLFLHNLELQEWKEMM